MSYVPGYQYDFFISYAHVDNKPVPEAELGWVDTLVEILVNGLAAKLGRQKAFGKYMDAQDLRGNHEVDTRIPDEVKRSALFLVVLSPGYLSSTFCLLELETFLKHIGVTDERLFVVYKEQIVEQRHTLPEPLRRPRKYQFWGPDKNNRPRTLGWPQPLYNNPKDRPYFLLVGDLCEDIADKLEQLKQQSAQGTAPKVSAAPAAPQRKAVLLAETTDDLLRKREEAQRYLQQAGTEVLPSGSYYRLSAEDYREALRRDLARCATFVQLLGPQLGRTPDDVPKGFGWLQYQVAKDARIPILQWCHPDLADMRTVEDEDQRLLLQNAEAMPFEEFKQKIVRRVDSLSRPAPPPRPTFLFINCDSVDTAQADDIGNHLRSQNIDWERPPYDDGTETRTLQESIESGLVNCDGLLIVHGKSPARWVRGQIQLYRKLRQRRATEPRVLALVQSGEAQEIKGLGLAGLKIVGLNELSQVIQPVLVP